MMWARSFGMPCLVQIAAVSLADSSYMAFVKYPGRSTHPSCSMPILRVL
jgi:hypothetical protein